MRQLDKSFFQKSIDLSAARIIDIKSTADLKTKLTRSKDLLSIRPIKPHVNDPDVPGAKCLLLQPGVIPNGKPAISVVCDIAHDLF